ncbi:MAG TPA: DUF4380 domain-containing protein [Polyangia bacterium]|nr:DUF4380 domain-containing protein [Polyangia bacterium]
MRAIARWSSRSRPPARRARRRPSSLKSAPTNVGALVLVLLVALQGAACSGGSSRAPSGTGGTSGSGGSASGSGGSGGSVTGSGGSVTGSGGVTGTGGTSGSGGAGGGTGGAGVPDGGSDVVTPTDAPGDGIAGDAASGPVTPVMRNGRWAFEMGDLLFEVDPQVGGRITTFALGGQNILTASTVHPIYWGSTFWTSPESQWMQPPPVQIDSAPFTAALTGNTLTLTGPPSPLLGVSITKTFSADRGRGAVQIEYKITNTKQTAVNMAPWEVTRVFPRGLTFFPTGPRTMPSNGGTIPITTAAGITWFAYDATRITSDSKIFADAAEGWLAHADQGAVFIKKFADLPSAQIAPNEGDVELYTNRVHTYIEMENQGPYVSIAPTSSTAWTVTWFLKRLPAGANIVAGDPALAEFVRSTIR